MAYILLYVDDIILATSSGDFRQSIISLTSSEFTMKHLRPLSYFLGIAVTHYQQDLFLSQKKYAKEILACARMSFCKLWLTPVNTNPKMSAINSNPREDPSLYRNLVGALQYLTFTRPDISYVVQQICLFMHNSMEDHMNSIRRILRYIQGTSQYGSHLYHSSIISLISHAYVDWGGCLDTRRSTSGYCVFIGDNLISWSSKRKPTLS